MEFRQILIVEDHQPTVEMWQRDIREFNDLGGVRFEAVFALTRSAAIDALEKRRLDCAVFDLRIPQDEKSDTETGLYGNDLIQQLVSDHGIPAVIYSAFPDEAKELTTVSTQIRVVKKRQDGAIQVLRDFAALDGLMRVMNLTRSRIEKETARIFQQSIWRRWETSWRHPDQDDAFAGVVTRQVVSHVAERLMLSPNNCHPAEFFIVPPLSADRLATGDMVRRDKKDYVVLTPRCNLERDEYPEHLILALCEPMDVWCVDLAARLAGSEGKRKKAEDELSKFATQGHAISQHFLPPCDDAGPWLVQFDHVITIPSTEASAALMETRFASIAPSFVPNIVQRYSAYLGRIGQPNLDIEFLKDVIVKRPAATPTISAVEGAVAAARTQASGEQTQAAVQVPATRQPQVQHPPQAAPAAPLQPSTSVERPIDSEQTLSPVPAAERAPNSN